MLGEARDIEKSSHDSDFRVQVSTPILESSPNDWICKFPTPEGMSVSEFGVDSRKQVDFELVNMQIFE